jgi:hypothetical protein
MCSHETILMAEVPPRPPDRLRTHHFGAMPSGLEPFARNRAPRTPGVHDRTHTPRLSCACVSVLPHTSPARDPSNADVQPLSSPAEPRTCVLRHACTNSVVCGAQHVVRRAARSRVDGVVRPNSRRSTAYNGTLRGCGVYGAKGGWSSSTVLLQLGFSRLG